MYVPPPLLVDKPLITPPAVFDIYETVVVFVSILVVNYAIADGKTNWLEGLVLMVIYVLIALTTWFYVSLPLSDGFPLSCSCDDSLAWNEYVDGCVTEGRMLPNRKFFQGLYFGFIKRFKAPFSFFCKAFLCQGPIRLLHTEVLFLESHLSDL